MDNTGQSDDDDTGIVPPGSHDFNFSEIAAPTSSANNNSVIDIPPTSSVINEYGPGAIMENNKSPPMSSSEISEEDEDDDEPEMIDKIIEEEVEIEEDVVSMVLFDDEYKSSEWYMSSSDVKTYHKYFIQADTNQDGVVDGNEANKFFTKSKLNRKLLAKIWVLSDQNKQGKLSEEMFCTMFHLVMKIKKSQGKLQVPQQLPVCLTIDVVGKLGTKIEKITKQKKIITQKKTIKVKNPNKKMKKSKVKKNKKKKNKTPPPLPQQQEVENNDDFGSNNDWGNDFSFDVVDTTQQITTDNTPGVDDTSQQKVDAPQQNDDNWNDFGSFFDQ